jgi:hypothetical protein
VELNRKAKGDLAELKVAAGAGMSYLTLRLSPSRNDQVRGIRLAERYTAI